jgi:hypothetical protein
MLAKKLEMSIQAGFQPKDEEDACRMSVLPSGTNRVKE